MIKAKSFIKGKGWEAIFQIGLISLVFVFFAFGRKGRAYSNFPFQWSEILFFGNYLAAALIINYVLLKRYLYKKKYLQFFISVAVMIAAVIFVEEAILEQIFYPHTRGKRFPGIFAGLVDALPIIIILTSFKFAWDALTKQSELEALESAVKESELQFLKSQVNPHFLFNNLNNLYSYALEKSPKTPQIILELSGLLRYMLYECQAKYVPLQREVEQLQHIINLSRLPLEGRGTVKLDIPPLPDGFEIAPLILPVFVENAFKHSLSSQSEAIEVEVALHVKKEGSLHFHCKNTHTPQTNTESIAGGIGLKNVEKRLQLLYPNKHKLTIDSSDHLYEVHLSLELHQTTSP